MGPNDKVVVSAISGFMFEAALYAVGFWLFDTAPIGDALSAGLFLTFLRRLYFFFRKKA